MATSPDVVAVIGDVVSSRSHPDRLALQQTLKSVLEGSASASGAVQPFSMTIGDEFQGIFAGLDGAIQATFRVQLGLVGAARVRFGIGVGSVVIMSERGPFEQDGPAWWDARDAIAMVKAAERSYGAPPHWSTAIGGDDESLTMARSYLQLRDHVIGGIDQVDAHIVQGLMEGDTQSAISQRLKLDKSAVSRRVSRHGLSALLCSLPDHA